MLFRSQYVMCISEHETSAEYSCLDNFEQYWSGQLKDEEFLVAKVKKLTKLLCINGVNCLKTFYIRSEERRVGKECVSTYSHRLFAKH